MRLFALAFDYKLAKLSFGKYFLMNFIRSSRFRFFNLRSRITDSDLVLFVIVPIIRHGRYGNVDITFPLLCKSILFERHSV